MAAADTPTPSAEPPARRVLVAEDEALIRLDLIEMLRDEGYEVCAEAPDGEKALELARELRPDLVILDIKMPKMDGLAVAAAINEERIAPVILLTAFSQRDLVEKAQEAGVMAYLTKPFSQPDLVPAIEMAAARFAEMRALEAEISDLADRIETRKLIDRAKGYLMTEHKLTEPQAFRWIQQNAMERRTTMKQVASAILQHQAESSGS